MLGELKDSAKEGAELVRTVTRNLMTKFDFNEYGGAPLLGVGGIVIICHGASDYRGIKNAVRASRDFSRQNVNTQITNFLANSSGGDNV
jgi:glycerol-3-phosphate acyltransferase PlsX